MQLTYKAFITMQHTNQHSKHIVGSTQVIIQDTWIWFQLRLQLHALMVGEILNFHMHPKCTFHDCASKMHSQPFNIMRQNNNLMVLNTTLKYNFFSQGKTRHNTDDSKILRGRTKKVYRRNRWFYPPFLISGQTTNKAQY